MSGINHEFRQYTTSAAFQISLSAWMVDALALIGSQSKHEYPRTFSFVAYHSLKRRGLIDWTHAPRSSTFLTEEGKLVLELCRRAGLVAQPKTRAA